MFYTKLGLARATLVLTPTPASAHRRPLSSHSLSLQRPRHVPLSGVVVWRQYQSTASVEPNASSAQSLAGISSLATESKSRRNEIGVQQISENLYRQVFPRVPAPISPQLIKLAEKHLRHHDLLGKSTDGADPIAFDLPPLQGRSLDEHFHKLGVDAGQPFLDKAKDFAEATLPPKPEKWIHKSGWYKYIQGRKPKSVPYPDATLLSFDTEVMYKHNPFAVMACAASPDAWYVWVSPWLLGETENEKQLIPLGDPTTERIIVGHNVGYDRARILEEYDLKQTRNCFLDTMSLHVAVNGMCSQQRPAWMRHKKNKELRERVSRETDDAELAQLLENGVFEDELEELWLERSSVNTLRDVAKLHLDVDLNKEVRNAFGELDRKDLVADLSQLLTYCATDVAITHRVFHKVFSSFLNTCPHPVSFAALRHLSSVILPINKSWDSYIKNSEATYKHLSAGVHERLVSLTEKAVSLREDAATWQNDPWLKQLDWSGQGVRMTKPKKEGEQPRPVANQKLPGMPKWYKGLFPKASDPIKISVRSRVAALLLRLAWDGHPLVWSAEHGWTFRVPSQAAEQYTAKKMVPCEFNDEVDISLKKDDQGVYFKLPHKNGPKARCANPMAKGYLAYFEKGTLSSEFPYAKEALEMNASCSYWISARGRIMAQMVVYEGDLRLAHEAATKENSKPKKTKASTKRKAKKKKTAAVEEVVVEEADSIGFILPQVIPMGTVTRRAVENTWLTASNAKKNRVGSELKAMVRAPPGYIFVGADVDSEELWIASVMGDASFKLHGGNAIGFMTLEGTKAAGTDLHSRTASILGISRNDAKVFNYGRIYGAGVKFAAQLLRQFNPLISENETLETANKLYASTKGTKMRDKNLHKRPFWRGGTESLVFNKLEEFAEQDNPRTPVLGAGITEALRSRNVSKGEYLTSRINWAVQSSGVDYLHLLIVSMDYLIRRYNLAARLAITVHDEIRYLVRDEDKYRAALALQVANLWTRAMFAQQVGIDDLPQSCAFFSAVDIDHVLRKEVDMECITPSNPTPIAPGQSLDISALLDKGEAARLDEKIVPAQYAPDLAKILYAERTSVMEELRQQNLAADHAVIRSLRAQIARNDEEFNAVTREARLRSTGRGSKFYQRPRNKVPGTPGPEVEMQTVSSPDWAPKQGISEEMVVVSVSQSAGQRSYP